MLDNSVVFNSSQCHTRVMDGSARRWDVHPLSCMSPLRRETYRNLISFLDDRCDGMLQIREGEKELAYEIFNPFWSRENFGCQSRVASIPHLLINAAHQGFV